MTALDVVDAYGMQREICLRAEPDAEGNPRRPPMDPVGATLHLTGALSRPHLLRAIELVTSRADVLQGRLAFADHGFTFVRTGPPEIPITTVDLRGRLPDDYQRRMAYLFRCGTDLLLDLQDGPPGFFVVAAVADDEHIVYTRFDHGRLDAQAMFALLRRLGRTYGRLINGEDPTEELAGWQAADFFAHARRAESDVEARRAADAFWRPFVRDSVCELALPGRSWRSWRHRRSTEDVTWVMPDADVQALSEARRATGASQVYLLLAALTVVLAGATDTEFIPLSYYRYGREYVEPLIGPLWDVLITIPPPDPDAALARWVTDFASANAQVPSMNGLALVDFASLDKVMELRRFAVNTTLPGRPLFFGPLRAKHYVPANGARDPFVNSSRVYHNMGIRLVPLGADRFKANLHYDPDDFADSDRIFTAACHVVRRVTDHPRMSMNQARYEALRVLRGES